MNHFWLVALLFFSTSAQTAYAGDGVMISTGIMALTNSTEQGGKGSSGSTILTESELIYHDPTWWGAGMYVQYDLQGSNQTDFAMGLKGELHTQTFFLELGYAFMMQRSFTDRSIAKQSGSGYQLGLGCRFPFGEGSTYGKGKYLQFSYKYRTQVIKTQDSTELDEQIKQTDGFPLFGIGYDF